MYAVVPTATVTYALGTGAPDGAAAPASFVYPSGDLADIALDAPTYTSDYATFAGWSLDGSVVAAIPAGTAGDVTLVATWTAAQTIQVNTSSTDTPALKDITVTDAWVAENVEKAGETATPAEIKAALETTEANGNKAWENYVLGLDADAQVSADAGQGSTTAMPVASTIAATAVDTGFTVTYQIDEVDTDGQVVASGEESAQATPDLAIDLTQVTSNAYFKVTATIKTDAGDTVSTVTSTNVIGVLAVTNAPATTIVAVPWKGTDGEDISVSNLVRTANLTPGDTLTAYDAGSGKYRSWTLSDDKTWEPTAVVGGAELAGADTNTVARGSGVWLTRQDPSQPIYLVGGADNAAEAAETPLEAATVEDDKTKPSWNIVASPKVEPVDVAEILDAGRENDRVIVPTAGAPKNYEYRDGHWGYWTTRTVTFLGMEAVESVFKTDDTYIPAGTGFWYLNSSTAAGAKIEW